MYFPTSQAEAMVSRSTGLLTAQIGRRYNLHMPLEILRTPIIQGFADAGV